MKKVIFSFCLLFSVLVVKAQQSNAIKGTVNEGTEVVTIFDEQGRLVTGNLGPAGDKIVVTAITVSIIKDGKDLEMKTTGNEGEAKINDAIRKMIKENPSGTFYIEGLKGTNMNGTAVDLPAMKCKFQ